MLLSRDFEFFLIDHDMPWIRHGMPRKPHGIDIDSLDERIRLNHIIIFYNMLCKLWVLFLNWHDV